MLEVALLLEPPQKGLDGGVRDLPPGREAFAYLLNGGPFQLPDQPEDFRFSRAQGR